MEHRVEDDKQLSHASGEHNFGGLPSGSEPVGEGANDGVAAAGGQGRHVQDLPYRGSATHDATFASVRSAIVVERSDADQGADGLAIEPSQLGQLGNERGAGHWANAWRATEHLDLGLPIVVGFQQAGNLGFDLGDLLVERFEELPDALAGGAGGGLFQTVGLHRP